MLERIAEIEARFNARFNGIEHANSMISDTTQAVLRENRRERTGVVYHQTVKPREWWVEQFARCGLHPKEDLFEVADFVRGSGNPRADDWDVRNDPDLGFHLVLQRAT